MMLPTTQGILLGVATFAALVVTAQERNTADARIFQFVCALVAPVLVAYAVSLH
jgi:hypothetical protein